MACLAGQAWAGQAWCVPVFNMLLGISRDCWQPPRGSRVSSIPILAPGQDPESSCGVGKTGELREEERAYLMLRQLCLRLCLICPSKATSSGDPPCGPEFCLPRGFPLTVVARRKALGLGKSPWPSALPSQHFSLARQITTRCTSGKAGGPPRTRSRAPARIRWASDRKSAMETVLQYPAEVRPPAVGHPPSRCPDGFLNLTDQTSLASCGYTSLEKNLQSAMKPTLFSLPGTSWGLLLLKCTF